MILALAGGVGGAKLAAGLVRVLAPSDLVIAVNTGDDFEHLGLHISPDVDTVLYNLAQRENPETGWGLKGDSWQFMQALGALGGPTWFQLGDRDLATHVARTQALARGETLSEITARMAHAFGVAHRVVPMSDDPVRTVVHTEQGVLAFQDYFVRLRCEPRVEHIHYQGTDNAVMSPGLRAALEHEALRAVLICPSNPLLSIAPILALSGLRDLVRQRALPVIAVSPFVGARALKGPAAKLFTELGMEVSSVGVARYYADLVHTLVIDESDRQQVEGLCALGMRAHVTNTIMRDAQDKIRLAHAVMQLIPTGRE